MMMCTYVQNRDLYCIAMEMCKGVNYKKERESG